MPYTVGELAKLTGVTVRALHHYDEIGLVRPSERSAAGYRLYDDRDVRRLEQVLWLRELGLGLDAIGAALADKDAVRELLLRHREALVSRRARLDELLAVLDEQLDRHAAPLPSERIRELFDGFDPSVYDAEVEAKWGDTEAFRESQRRTRRYTRADWERYREEAKANGARLVELMRAGHAPEAPLVAAAVEEHRALIDRWFYPCPPELHRQLGAMYVADPRFTENLDRLAPGFAQFLSAAILATGR